MLIRCAVGVTLLWLLSVRDKAKRRQEGKTAINWRGYKHLKAGMAVSQVEGHLGCPPGNYGQTDLPLNSTSKVRYWIDDEMVLEIWFKSDGTMFGKQVFLMP